MLAVILGFHTMSRSLSVFIPSFRFMLNKSSREQSRKLIFVLHEKLIFKTSAELLDRSFFIGFHLFVHSDMFSKDFREAEKHDSS